jgi:threonine dehydratase
MNYLQYYSKLIPTANIYNVVKITPLEKAYNLSLLTNNKILLKREDMQKTFSFKIRGAYNKLLQLTIEEIKKGVVCSSAGNFAQGVAYSCKELRINSTIVMPVNTPLIKINSVKQYGGKYVNILLYGNNYDESSNKAKEIEREDKKIMIHPFNDKHVISGQGTIGYELLKQCNHIDKIFIPCGGGGLLSGIALWVKYINPSIKIIGVEASDSAGMTKSLKNNYITKLNSIGTFADGTAVCEVGSETFNICRQYVDEMVTVSTDEICAAIKLGYNDTRVLLETSGALSIAGMQKYIKYNNISNKTIVAVTSGANIDFNNLRFISERTDLDEKLLYIKIKENTGEFQKLCNDITNFGGYITEFNYKYSDHNNAYIHMSLKVNNSIWNSQSIISNLINIGYEINDLTDNELAKVHTRYMTKNSTINLSNQVFYRFEFPNTPNSLKIFLNKMKSQWNITLFHYRNIGSDIGRILVGFQITKKDNKKFLKYIKDLNYIYYDETNNYNL